MCIFVDPIWRRTWFVPTAISVVLANALKCLSTSKSPSFRCCRARPLPAPDTTDTAARLPLLDAGMALLHKAPTVQPPARFCPAAAVCRACLPEHGVGAKPSAWLWGAQHFTLPGMPSSRVTSTAAHTVVRAASASPNSQNVPTICRASDFPVAIQAIIVVLYHSSAQIWSHSRCLQLSQL